MPQLIVETGDVIDGANTYVPLDEAASYHARMGNEWDESADEDNSRALLIAARSLDMLWGASYRGRLLSDNQPMLFPRSEFMDSTGRKLARGLIPRVLREAQCELALLVLQGVDVMPTPVTGSIKSESVTVDVISKTTTYGAVKEVSRFPGLEKIEMILSPILSAPSANWTIKV